MTVKEKTRNIGGYNARGAFSPRYELLKVFRMMNISSWDVVNVDFKGVEFSLDRDEIYSDFDKRSAIEIALDKYNQAKEEREQGVKLRTKFTLECNGEVTGLIMK